MTKVIISLFLLWTISLSFIGYKFIISTWKLQQQMLKNDKLTESFEEYLRMHGKINNSFKCVTREP